MVAVHVDQWDRIESLEIILTVYSQLTEKLLKIRVIKRTASSNKVMDFYVQKYEQEPHLILYTKVNTKWFKILN